MCEEAAIYRLDAKEQEHQADELRLLWQRTSVEANRLRERVRELEDAILKHQDATWKRTRPEDDALYDQILYLWT